MLQFDTGLSLALTDMALRMGVTANNIQLGGSIESAESLGQRFDVLQRGGIPHEELSQSIRGLATHADISEERVVRDLLSTEGRIWAGLSMRASLPDDQVQRLRETVEGRGDVSMLGVLEANRWIREPFIEGLLYFSGGQAKPFVKTTPLLPFPKLAEKVGRPVFVKFEGRQKTGSLKVRGALYVLAAARLLGRVPHKTRVVAASLGNHAIGVMAAAQVLGFEKVEIVLPKTVDAQVGSRLSRLGAKIHVVGGTLEQAEEIARFMSGEDPDALFIGRSDHPMSAMGLGTIGVEIDAQMTRSQNFQQYGVVIPVGGGGLAAGIGTYFKTRDVPVFGVQAEAYSNLYRSFQKREIVTLPTPNGIPTLAHSVAIQAVGTQLFPVVRRVIDDMTAMSETAISEAMSYMDDAGFMTEGAAALPVAAMLSGVFESLWETQWPSKMPIVLVHTGENIEQDALDALVRRSHSVAGMRAVAPPEAPHDRTTRPAPAPRFDAQGNPDFEDLPEPSRKTEKPQR